MLCRIHLPCGTDHMGGVRLSPPSRRPGDSPLARATGIVADINGVGIDILSGSERGRVGLLAHQALPLRIMLIAESPIKVIGLHQDSPTLPLEPGTWSRPLSHVDLAPDLRRLSPLGCR